MLIRLIRRSPSRGEIWYLTQEDSCCCKEGVEDDSTGKTVLEQIPETSREGQGAKYLSRKHHIREERNLKEWEDTTENKQPDV